MPRWEDDPMVEAAKDNGGGGVKSEVRKIGWGESNK